MVFMPAIVIRRERHAAVREACAVCGEPMRVGVVDWIRVCDACGFQSSTLEPGASSREQDRVSNAEFDAAIGATRDANFATILDALVRHDTGKRLLDVGCYRGGFLAAARLRGFQVTGIEPTAAVAAETRAGGFTVLDGFFPDVLPHGAAFDVITFNDVFEHIPDPNAAAAACRRHLVSGGLLSVNLPNSEGAGYAIAIFAAQLGVTGPLSRVWQAPFASPHVSYFSPRQLARLMTRNGFVEIERRALPSMHLSGLWTRIGLQPGQSLAARVAQFVGGVAAYPLLRARSDIALQIFRATPLT
jgi:SAM-dependent methyltransferase